MNNYFKIMKDYIKKDSFLIFITEELLMKWRKNKVALDILFLSTSLKVKNKLEKKYHEKLLEFDKCYDKNLNHEKSDKIWICWFQGIENAPEIVKICYNSVKNELSDKKVELITKENIFDYIDFPEYIMKKWEKNIITDTHMSDLLRLELLIKYGGLWLDATVFCSHSNIPKYIFNSDLFFYQYLNIGKQGHSAVISSWLISAKSNNRILMATRHLLYEYWKNNNEMLDYFILHYFMTMALEFYQDDWNKIIPVSNSTPHILLFQLFEEYDENIWQAIKDMTCFHKLTYKFEDDKRNLENTYYKKILFDKY